MEHATAPARIRATSFPMLKARAGLDQRGKENVMATSGEAMTFLHMARKYQKAGSRLLGP